MLQLGARGELRLFERALGELAVPEKLPRVRHAAHVEAVQPLRLEAFADDEFRRAAADVDHQPALAAHRQAVRDAEVNQARFFAPGDDFNREAERGFGFFKKRGRVFRHAQGVGAERAHVVGLKAAQAFGKALQAGDGARLRRLVQHFVSVQPGAQAHRLPQAVQRVGLLAVYTCYLAVERIGSEVDSRDGVVFGHGM